MHPANFLSCILGAVLLIPVMVQAAGAESNSTGDYTVSREVHRDTSAPMRNIIANLSPAPPADPTDYVVPNILLDLDDLVVRPDKAPPSPVQRGALPEPMPTVDLAVNGMRIGLGGGGVPPDTTGDVGPDHFFQWVNTSWALFDKGTGAMIGSPVPGNSFFAGFGGLCETTDRGDPLVLWDDHAQRWVVSQFAFTTTTAPPFLQCVAVSATADPLGAYHRYAFSFPNFNDYGKMGVWVTGDGGQNAYVFSMHEFLGGYQGSSFSVVERDRMLNGESAQFIRFGGIDTFGAIPFHLEGNQPMPAGACPVFVHFSFTTAAYNLWDLCVDWAAGTGDFDPEPTVLESEPFTIGLNGIPQIPADSTARLDDFDSNNMYIAALRAFGPTGPAEAQGVINHAVDVGDDQAGARWVLFGISAATPPPPVPGEIQKDGFETPRPPQGSIKRILGQGTYSPDDHNRWMGGINLDQSGNIALGYNVSSETLNPEIRITGRLRTEQAGLLRDETQCSPTDTGAQTGLFDGRARWGDYATMAVDPDDQCTFWFTNEYYPVTSFSTWDTRICSLTFPTCGDPDFLLEVTPQSRIPVCGVDASAEVRVGEFATLGSNVNLSEGDVPGGVSLSFDSTSLAAGESTAVALNGSASLADGEYFTEVLGAALALNRSVNVDIGVSATTPGAPVLNAPASGSSGNVARPTYSWDAASGGIEYLIEVAQDAGFTQIVDSAVVTGTSYVSSLLLDNETTYFWRLTPLNYCGPGATTAAFSFTTGVPGECPSGTTAQIVFFDDIAGDGVAWTTENVSGDPGTHWAKVTPPAGTGLNTRAWWAGNSSTTGDQRLISPLIALPAGAGNLRVVLAFDAYHQYETDGPVNCWDGALVEISTNNGVDWTPLGNDRNLADAYPGFLSSGNPASGEYGWCRQPAGGNSVETIFLLDEFAGQNVQFRFRSTSDSNTVGPAPAGWGVDNVLVQRCED
jgi:hypothetical protein